MKGFRKLKWQHLQVQVVNKVATIYLEKQPVYTITFKNDFRKLVGLVFNFSGTGAVDYVKLRNDQHKIMLDDEFDK
ncbi:hypothetical protein [Flavitalea sp.]|nr:hypothetical protein [Flavitalea sp.]